MSVGAASWTLTCDCGGEVSRFRGESDVRCCCGAWFNAFGQRLRDDWASNRSNWDADIGDVEGMGWRMSCCGADYDCACD